jgi:putative oxidoreductase
MELAGGIMILNRLRGKNSAWLIVFFMIPVTFSFHQFWKIKDPMQKQMEMATFLKNISILGGALILTYLAPAT